MLTLDLVVVSTMSVYKATFNKVGCACFFTMSIPDFFTYLLEKYFVRLVPNSYHNYMWYQ